MNFKKNVNNLIKLCGFYLFYGFKVRSNKYFVIFNC